LSASKQGFPSDDYDPEFDVDRERELMDKPRNWPSVARYVGGLWVVYLIDIDDFPEIRPHRRMILLALLVAVKDRAQEVHFEPWRFEADAAEVGVRMLYQVDGQLAEMVPAPACLAAPLFRDLKDIAGLNAPRRRVADLLRRLADWIDGRTRTPRRGRFRLNLSGENADVEVLVYESKLGERYFLNLPPIAEAVSAAAEREMARLLRLWFMDKSWHPPRR